MKVKRTPTILVSLIVISFLLLLTGCAKEETPLDQALKNEAGEVDQNKANAATEILKAIDSYNASYPSNPINPSSFFSGVNQNTFKSLKDYGINNITDIPGKIENLNNEIKATKDKLPKYVMVKKGDTERSLRIKVLTEEYGLSKEEASKVIAGFQRCRNLQAGWKMWYYYDESANEFFAGYTKGDAKITPAQAQAQVLKNIEIQYGNKFTTYNNRISKLETKVENVTNEIKGLKENLEKTKQYYTESIEKIENKFEEFQNIMKYIAGTEEELEGKMVIEKGVLLNYNHNIVKEFDIREASLELPFSTATYKEVKVLPKTFMPTDYTITQSGGKFIFKINSGRETKFLDNVVVFAAVK